MPISTRCWRKPDNILDQRENFRNCQKITISTITIGIRTTGVANSSGRCQSQYNDWFGWETYSKASKDWEPRLLGRLKFIWIIVVFQKRVRTHLSLLWFFRYGRRNIWQTCSKTNKDSIGVRLRSNQLTRVDVCVVALSHNHTNDSPLFQVEYLVGW